jgi:hypothetical protein
VCDAQSATIDAQLLEPNFLYIGSFHVRAAEGLSVSGEMVGMPTGDTERDRKAALISVEWLDKATARISATAPGWSVSPKYGLFSYIALPNDSGSFTFDLPISPPDGAVQAKLSLVRFSNYSLSLRTLNLTYKGHG